MLELPTFSIVCGDTCRDRVSRTFSENCHCTRQTNFFRQAATPPRGADGLARLQELQPDCIVLDHGSEGERLEILAAVRDGDVLSCAVVEIDGDSTRDRVNGVIHLQKNALCEESAAAAVRVAINLARLARENDLLVSRLCESKCHLNAFIRQAPLAIAMFDADMRHLAYSRKWLDVARRLRAGNRRAQPLPTDVASGWRGMRPRGAPAGKRLAAF